MAKAWTLALDLEGTLISNAISQIPRPGLFNFLKNCKELFGRIVIYTAIDEPRFREIAKTLIRNRYAPEWFEEIEYIHWDKTTKNLNNIPSSSLEKTLLIEDFEEYIHLGQEHRWIKISQFKSPYSVRDRQLHAVIKNQGLS